MEDYQMTVQRILVARRLAALGTLVGLGTVSPVYGATLNLPLLNLPLTPSDYVLGVLLVALIAALGVSLARGHDEETPLPGGPDLRWWKGSHT
jgi:hypothetical protein